MLCKKCFTNYELEDYDKYLTIPKIMASKGYCFNCAYWLYRHNELYNIGEFKRPEDLGYVELKLANINPGDTLQVITRDFEMITLHICKPNPINLNQVPVYKVQGKDGTYLFNVSRVTYQGKISLGQYFIPNATRLDNDLALGLIDRQSTKIINHLYYEV